MVKIIEFACLVLLLVVAGCGAPPRTVPQNAAFQETWDLVCTPVVHCPRTLITGKTEIECNIDLLVHELTADPPNSYSCDCVQPSGNGAPLASKHPYVHDDWPTCTINPSCNCKRVPFGGPSQPVGCIVRNPAETEDCED